MKDLVDKLDRFARNNGVFGEVLISALMYFAVILWIAAALFCVIWLGCILVDTLYKGFIGLLMLVPWAVVTSILIAVFVVFGDDVL